jgi:hypothetical protein
MRTVYLKRVRTSQMRFSDFEHACKCEQTQHERFPAEMDRVVLHLLQNGFALSDLAMEEALYKITSLRQFARESLIFSTHQK